MIEDEVTFTNDVLTMTVLVGESGYPSLNRIGADGRRNGRKSAAYNALFTAVAEAGRAAMQDGWKMVEYPCDVYIRRYCMKNAPRDGLNIGHVEQNALTFCKVWADDRLAHDPHPSWVLDPAGPERVVITIIRKPQVGAQKPALARNRKSDVGKPVQESTRKYNEVHGAAIPAAARVATLNGKPISAEEALRMVRSGRSKR